MKCGATSVCNLIDVQNTLAVLEQSERLKIRDKYETEEDYLEIDIEHSQHQQPFH